MRRPGQHERLCALKLWPVFHYREDRIRAHVQLCWFALLLIRTVEHTVGDTWLVHGNRRRKWVGYSLDRERLAGLRAAIDA